MVRSGTLRFVDAGLEALSLVSQSHVGVLMTDTGVEEGLFEFDHGVHGVRTACRCQRSAGATRELVVDGVTGFLVPAGDHRSSRKSSISSGGLETCVAISASPGKKRILEQFPVHRMVDDYVSLYLQLLGR